MPFGETIVALATPPGESAIAVIRLSGPDCLRICKEALSGQSELTSRQSSLRYYMSLNGDTLDSVLAVLYADGKSYTGEAMLELSCHGNPLIVQRLIEDLITRGCRPAEPGEFTRTAYLNERMDLSQAEAVADIITARSERAIEAAQRQLAGRLGHLTNQLVDRLLGAQAQVEAYIDFPEEDLPEENTAGPIQELCKVAHDLEQLIETAHYKASLSDGIQTVIAGAPNAGKSSLLNQLLGEDRAIVSPTPGTTRDYITERITVGPYTLKITDTAGIHEVTDDTEAQGIDKSLERLKQADFILLVIDSADGDPHVPDAVKNILESHKCLIVMNKCDIANKADHPLLPDFEHLSVSAKTGQGLMELRAKLAIMLETNRIVPHPDTLLINSRQASAFALALESLQAAIHKLKNGQPSELAGSDIREAVEAISKVVGRIDNEAMLDKLFAHFCIGK